MTEASALFSEWDQPEQKRLLVVCPIDSGRWLAIGGYAPVDGALHMCDLSIVPGPPPMADATPFLPDVTPGQWLRMSRYLEHARYGGPGKQPLVAGMKAPKAVYARLLRMVPFDLMQQKADEEIPHYRAFERSLRESGADPYHLRFGEALKELDVAGVTMTDERIRYLEAASFFARNNKDMTNAKIADALQISPDQLRDRLAAARDLGWLTRPGRGRKGGNLTEQGKALAARHLRKSK